MGRRNKQSKERLGSSSDGAEEDKNEAFTKCLSGRLEALGLCASEDEYSSISEAIAASAPVATPPSEDDLEAVTSSLLEYFEDVSAEDAKALVYAAAFDAWGADVSHITASLNGEGGEGDESCGEIDANDGETNSDDFDDDDDSGGGGGDFIGEGECELCERSIKLTRHHLVPKSAWSRMKKRLWNAAPVIESLHSLSLRIDGSSGQRQQDLQEKQRVLQDKLEKILGGTASLSDLPATITHDSVRAYLSQVSLLCRQCHSAVHRIHTEWELATEYNTMDRLLECEEVMKFGRWANKQRPGKYAVN